MRTTRPTDAGRSRVRPLAVLLGALVGLAAWGGAEATTLGTKAEANGRERAKLEALKAENARTEAMIADYDRFEQEAARTEAEYAVAIAAVPTEAELAGALDDLQRVTAASGVSLARFSPRPAAPGAPNALGLESRPIDLSLRCGFPEYRALLRRLAEYPRLLTVESFAMRSANDGPYTIEATVGLNCYFKPAPAAATPAGR